MCMELGKRRPGVREEWSDVNPFVYSIVYNKKFQPLIPRFAGLLSPSSPQLAGDGGEGKGQTKILKKIKIKKKLFPFTPPEAALDEFAGHILPHEPYRTTERTCGEGAGNRRTKEGVDLPFTSILFLIPLHY